jgi:hypothetical protein
MLIKFMVNLKTQQRKPVEIRDSRRPETKVFQVTNLT